jgi:hypothetical protein
MDEETLEMLYTVLMYLEGSVSPTPVATQLKIDKLLPQPTMLVTATNTYLPHL